MLSWRTPAISGIIGGTSLARAKPGLALHISRGLHTPRAADQPAFREIKFTKDQRHQLPSWRIRPAWNTKRRAYVPISPSAVILERLYTRGSRMTREQWDTFQLLASNRSTRLPVMTAQLLLRQEEASLRTSLSERLTDDSAWKFARSWDKRLTALAHTGVTEHHLRHWVWILQGDTADERVERFLSATVYKPVFLLFIMIAKNHSILDRQLFMSLLDYISKTYCQPRSQAPDHRSQHRSLDHHLNMTPVHFMEMLGRLINQALRLCPEAVVTIAEVVTSYLKTKSAASAGRDDNGFSTQCLVFNRAIEALSRTSYLRPFANIKHNWEAQKHLLAFSTALRRPLIINEAGYRAIQSVMAARPKSEDEEKVAIRSSKSWPPYREAWDGVDEQRHLEDDLSRAVKAGILAREAGYPDTDLDRASGAAGGAVLDDSPTVQTRSRPRMAVGGSRAAENVYTTWAARVRATRNAQEAWAIFQRPPQTGLRPTAFVYAEMFAKLLAREVVDPSSAVPGNTKEVMPVYQPGNLSEFEKWRLQPPTIRELYDAMLRSQVMPVGHVLRLLVANANSEGEMLRYLQDSPYQEFAAAVRDRDKRCPPSQAEFFAVEEVYRSVPLATFGAYVSFLCKMQRRVYSAAQANHGPVRTHNSYLQRALAVVAVRLRPETAEGRTYKPPWYDVLRTMVLARTHGALVTVARRQIGMFLEVFRWVRTNTGMDGVLLEIMCLSVGRVMAANFTIGGRGTGEKWWVKQDAVGGEEQAKMLARAWVDVMAAFEEMKKPGSGMNGFQVYTYVRVLGMFDATDEMVVVMRWVLARLEEGGLFEGGVEEGSNSHAYLVRAFRFVEAYAARAGRKDEVGSIRARRKWLVEEGFPFALGEMGEGDKEDVDFVSDIAEGWRRYAADEDG